MNCPRCGTQNDGNAQFCKTCGLSIGTTPYAYYAAPAYPQQPPAKQTNTLALIGLILAVFMPLAGLIVSVIARKQCAERGEEGEKLAKAGIIVSIAYIALIVLIVAGALAIPFILLSPLFDAPVLFDLPPGL